MILSIVAALAVQGSTPAPATAERPVCRASVRTGSIMPGKRVCHTRAEWAALADSHRGETDDFRDRATNAGQSGGQGGS